MNNGVVRIVDYRSPAGDLLLGDIDGRLCLCDWVREGGKFRKLRESGLRYERRLTETTERAINELDGYFSGAGRRFDVPLQWFGTPFQKSVWTALLDIPFGETISYKEVARRIGNVRAVRAVAGANHANRLSIFVPCHRVIGSDGSLTGYAGGLEAKSFLLELERNAPPQSMRSR